MTSETDATPAGGVSGQATKETDKCRFSSEQYHWLIDSGILTTEHRVELIAGEIRSMAPTGDKHADSIELLNHWLVTRAKQVYNVRCQTTLRVAEGFTPDPDFTLLKYRDGGYARGPRPTPEDVLLIIEVADSSLSYDLGEKALAYSRAGVPEQWVVDIPHRQVHVLSYPSSEGYRSVADAGENDSVIALLIPELELPVAEAM